MNTDGAAQGEAWHYAPETGLRERKGAPDGDWIDLVVTDQLGNVRAFLLPEWLADRIIEQHLFWLEWHGKIDAIRNASEIQSREVRGSVLGQGSED